MSPRVVILCLWMILLLARLFQQINPLPLKNEIFRQRTPKMGNSKGKISMTHFCLNLIMAPEIEYTTPRVSSPLTPLPCSDSPPNDQLAVPFDYNTPYWVPILLKSFDSLKNDMHATVHALSL